MQWLVAALPAGAVALSAWRIRALTHSGALAALAVGTITFGCGGWQAAAVLFAFFLPSVALSRVGRGRKNALVDVGKHGARDAWQVLANGGVAALCILAWRLGAPLAAAFSGAFAAAAADTWGTEIGVLARAQPRSILTWQRLPTGLSGGISLQGSIATLAGAALVGIVAALVHLGALLPVTIGGFAGALLDSLLGASAQSLRWCPQCHRACETDPHACGSATTLRRGWQWLSNDAVNFAATLCGAAVAGALSLHWPIR